VPSALRDSFLVVALGDDGPDGTQARARLRGNLTSYDARYVAVAELFHAPLLTYDAKMAGAPGTHCTFEVFPAAQ
jgi:hypothetical protein